MYFITVERTFSAMHRLRLPDGSWEPLHGHDWKVQATMGTRTLNADGTVVDFHLAQRILAEALAPLHCANLNTLAPFLETNPTAEHVARHILESLGAQGLPVRRVSVTEAPGCEACYEVTDV